MVLKHPRKVYTSLCVSIVERIFWHMVVIRENVVVTSAIFQIDFG